MGWKNFKITIRKNIPGEEKSSNFTQKKTAINKIHYFALTKYTDVLPK